MKSNRFMKLASFILIIYTLLAPTNVLAKSGATETQESELASSFATSDGVEISSRILGLFKPKGGEKKALTERAVILGGDAFGLKIKQDGVTVTDTHGILGINVGDVILSVNGKKVESAEDVRKMVAASRGESVTLGIIHRGSEIELCVRPRLESGEYRLGVTLRDSAVGIGTVTFVDPETGLFAGLGHAICDNDSGEIIPMESGEICGVVLGGIRKGESGKPGELSGILTEEGRGVLYANTECGVFGFVDPTAYESETLYKIASRDELKEGEATIVCTLKNGKKAEYKIEIEDIDRGSTGSKSFRIKVTDKALTALTGGIVRGMSGSPIIQNGKLVGAVTHVLVANPTEGYGIFIENMLNAAKNQVQPKAA